MSEESTHPMAEVKAMGKLADAVAGLDADATARVLRWAVDRYSVAVSSAGRVRTGGTGGGTSNGGDTVNGSGTGHGSGSGAQQFTDLAELHAATTPETDADRALVAGYWAQFGEGKPDFGSQEINAALKNLGHQIGNITSAFDTLKARKPAPVMQLKKAGSSKQARKTYKLTLAGKSAVEAMIAQ